jgi:hypothetical protein
VFAPKNLEMVLILKPRKLDTDVESASVPDASGNRPVLAGKDHKGAWEREAIGRSIERPRRVTECPQEYAGNMPRAGLNTDRGREFSVPYGFCLGKLFIIYEIAFG